ncbi:MAG: hypothetical protein J0J01_25820 [Reyranella sp.]|uniref:hypothetical protein n=1 Tax=Reyranella sp. TaxID=1929291 RepID=UPI001AC910A0|nr:hypothetical protein [Reyranella sp.]MBN9090345.1 hypothetical protein [Reyranella sp.]
MPRRTKRHVKSHSSNGKKRPPAPSGGGLWLNKPGADLSLLLSRVRAAQVRRMHFR